jgi:hypothetical protein
MKNPTVFLGWLRSLARASTAATVYSEIDDRTKVFGVIRAFTQQLYARGLKLFLQCPCWGESSGRVGHGNDFVSLKQKIFFISTMSFIILLHHR